MYVVPYGDFIEIVKMCLRFSHEFDNKELRESIVKVIKGLQDLQISRRRQTKITTFFTKKINSHVIINQLFFYFELFICYSEL